MKTLAVTRYSEAGVNAALVEGTPKWRAAVGIVVAESVPGLSTVQTAGHDTTVDGNAAVAVVAVAVAVVVALGWASRLQSE